MKITALAGGVGGAKLADGFAQCLLPEDLTIIVNTGDDFEHLGLRISPDLDTVCYTLAGLANPETGWGRADDTTRMLSALNHLGGPTWFHLGDQDLATHLERTRRLLNGKTLSRITHEFCQTWEVHHTILPMSDDPVRTMVETIDVGEMPFQEYFVHQKCEPQVRGFRFDGIEKAKPTPGVTEAILNSNAIIICPSNPWVSIGPILAVPGIRESISGKPVVAISPLIGARAFRGPAAKMYQEMGFQPSPLAVASHYGSLLSGFIMDTSDVELSGQLSVPVFLTNILMSAPSDRQRLAQDVLNFINSL